jgi:hypothetical protein
MQIILGWHGRELKCSHPLHLAYRILRFPICSRICEISALNADLEVPETQDILCFSQNFPLFPINSRVIPFLRKMKRTIKQGRLKTPNRHYETDHTGNRLHPIQEIRRASEQTSPPDGVRSWTPQRWDSRRIEQWQQLGPPFLFRGQVIPNV